MEREEIYQLMARYRAGKCSPEEVLLLMAWLDRMQTQQSAGLPADMQATVKQKILNNIHQAPASRNIYWKRWAAAAALLPLIAVAWWWKTGNVNTTATAWNSISTRKQEVKKVKLPDGSQVWLNASSRLEYPADFNSHRTVRITGHGYFDVAQNSQSPFLVEAADIKVKVLGTAFAVTHVKGQPARIAVATGKVQVTEKEQVLGILQASQQLIVTPQMAMMSYIDSTSIQSWTSGDLVMHDVPLQQVLWELENYHGVAFETKANIDACRLSVNFNQSMTLQNKLDIISRIIISPKIKFNTTDHKKYVVQ
ncbi:FecR family protein [Chitinophaga jiangningensis]|uniref:FecR family protein n=1 Tax=Chitinophaga jiangningensis TaxID=1419482 RepID=A0A1M7BPL6_9BACT|nr:FecR domain-containing protein [Chitinophaga jiangningensis]SHL56931.1 FecR family protein [Chitinophaga jiangningensis]